MCLLLYTNKKESRQEPQDSQVDSIYSLWILEIKKMKKLSLTILYNKVDPIFCSKPT